MNDKEFNSIIAILSEKYNLPYEVIEKTIRTQFKFVKETIEQGELDSVHLHYFGKFAAKPKRVEQLIEKGYEVKKNA